MFGTLLGLAVLIALFGISNTLSLSVIERTRESALLRALGLTKGQLRRMLLTEAMLHGAAGGGAGGRAGRGVRLGHGARVHQVPGGAGVVSIPYAEIAVFVAAGAVCAVLAAVLPARRAARVAVVSAMAES